MRSPKMGRREVLLPGWLLNTASQTPDTPVARQWETAQAGRDCRPEVMPDFPEHKRAGTAVPNMQHTMA